MSMRKSRTAFTLIELMIVVTILAILAAILVPNFKRARAKGQFSGCLSNCKNTGTALEMYAVDHSGRFPDLSGLAGLNQAVGHGVIKRLPTCPAAGTCTYSDYTSDTTPDRYSFTCVGANHRESINGFPLGNFPQYSNELGIVEHP
jgi:prepilin-type N-terminal cleavage/methylation domain-containing protein